MLSRATIMIFAPLLAIGIAGCEVQQEEPAEAPEIQVEPGEIPEYEIETGDIDVEQDTAVVTVPDVEVEPDQDPGR